MDITRVCDGDLPKIIELQRLAFFENRLRYGNDPNMPPLPQTLSELAEESQGQVFFMATMNGKIVGTIRGRWEGEICRVSKMMVHPDHQNKGIGNMLMSALEKEFNAQIYELKTGHLDEKNIAFYEKWGYVLTGEKEQATETLWFVRMRKNRTL
jgi:GNAT superfamily N-acetyltransferase